MKKKFPSAASQGFDGGAPREAALAVLKSCGPNAPVQAVLDEQLKKNRLSEQDKALVTELVYGVLRREISLTRLVQSRLKNPAKLPAEMQLLLVLASYEIFFLHRIPHHATVHCAVELTKSAFGIGLGKVTNGVLRSLTREVEHGHTLEDLLQGICAEQRSAPLASLEILYGLPAWILQLWSAAYGFEAAEHYARASVCVPFPCLRINTARLDWKEYRAELCSSPTVVGSTAAGSVTPHDPALRSAEKKAACFAVSGIRFAPGNAPLRIKEDVQAGKASWQGAGSQLLLDALLGETDDCGERFFAAPDALWDACCGFGGKTLALVEAGLSLHAASDINQRRLKGLRRDAARLGLTSPPLLRTSADMPPFKKSGGPKTILLDVPCSGLGTLARHPDLRRQRNPEHLAGMTLLQKNMLNACWDVLPDGGELMYMTCTVNPEENEGQVAAFLHAHPDAKLMREWASSPDTTGSDLMYGARLQKKALSRKA